MKDPNYKPDRLVFYPDGHRRWAMEQFLKGNFKTMEEAKYASYIRGAELCLVVAEEFRKRMGKVIDIFLTRPATYNAGIQGREEQGIIDIHEVIAANMLKVLYQKGISTKIYTRCDRPALSAPEGFKESPAVLESWENLVGVYNDLFVSGSTEEEDLDFQVNLLVNYDGALECKMLDNDSFLFGLGRGEMKEVLQRMLPVEPTADLVLRTCPPEDDNGYRLSSGPIRVLAETSFRVIPHASPYVTREMVESGLDEHIAFRQSKLHVPETLLDSSLWFRN